MDSSWSAKSIYDGFLSLKRSFCVLRLSYGYSERSDLERSSTAKVKPYVCHCCGRLRQRSYVVNNRLLRLVLNLPKPTIISKSQLIPDTAHATPVITLKMWSVKK